MSSMTGAVKLITSENFDGYMKSIGVDIRLRRALCSVTPVTEITNQGDNLWTIKSAYGPRTDELKFEMWEEFEVTMDDGRDCSCLFFPQAENKLVYAQQYHDNGQVSRIVCEFTDTEMKMTLEGLGDVVATRTFERLQQCEGSPGVKAEPADQPSDPAT